MLCINRRMEIWWFKRFLLFFVDVEVFIGIRNGTIVGHSRLGIGWIIGCVLEMSRRSVGFRMRWTIIHFVKMGMFIHYNKNIPKIGRNIFNIRITYYNERIKSVPPQIHWNGWRKTRSITDARITVNFNN